MIERRSPGTGTAESRYENSGVQVPEQRSAAVLVLASAALACSAVLVLASAAHAISNNAGTKNGEFLKIATDARGVALSDSMVSMARGADALRWNPAALGILDGREVSATHIEYYQDVHIENVSGVYPVEEGGLGASAFYLAPGALDGRDILGNATGDFSFYDMVGTLGFGRKMLTRAEGADVSVGAAIKMVQEKIAEQSFRNPAFDIGILATPTDNVNLGATFRNLSSGKANFVREMVGGASYTAFKFFTGAFAVNYSNDAPIRYSVGTEYRVPELDAAIRAGYTTRDSLDDSVDSKIPALRKASIAGLTMGGAIGYKPPMFHSLALDLEYAMAPFGALGISHTVTVKVRW